MDAPPPENVGNPPEHELPIGRASYVELYTNDKFREKTRRVMNDDFLYRKAKRWPLDVYHYNEKRIVTHSGRVINHLVDYSTRDEKERPKCEDFETLVDNTPLEIINLLLQRFPNNLALCGGSVLDIVTRIYYHVKDFDFFFCDCSKERAAEILEECYAIIADFYGLELGGQIERSLKFTNIVVKSTEKMSSPYDSEIIFQFIHRIYPTFDSILGGFDIPLSMIGYNGRDIFMTPLCSFCFEHEIVLADLGRRSPSFESRLEKYSRKASRDWSNITNYKIYFPGLKWFETNHHKLSGIDYYLTRKINKSLKGVALYFDFESNQNPYSDGLYFILPECKVTYYHPSIFKTLCNDRGYYAREEMDYDRCLLEMIHAKIEEGKDGFVITKLSKISKKYLYNEVDHHHFLGRFCVSTDRQDPNKIYFNLSQSSTGQEQREFKIVHSDYEDGWRGDYNRNMISINIRYLISGNHDGIRSVHKINSLEDPRSFFRKAMSSVRIVVDAVYFKTYYDILVRRL